MTEAGREAGERAGAIGRVSLEPPARVGRDPEKTRGRIMAAVVQSIAEVGFRQTSGAEITKRAGVTWGAVQHHFGDKNGILIAVLEDSFNQLAERLAQVDRTLALEDRAAAFVDLAWEHFGSDHYRSTFEILSHYAKANPEFELPTTIGGALAQIWSSVFGDAALSRKRSAALQRFTVSALAGLSSVSAFGAAQADDLGEELAILKDTLVRELGRSSDRGPAPRVTGG